MYYLTIFRLHGNEQSADNKTTKTGAIDWSFFTSPPFIIQPSMSNVSWLISESYLRNFIYSAIFLRMFSDYFIETAILPSKYSFFLFLNIKKNDRKFLLIFYSLIQKKKQSIAYASLLMFYQTQTTSEWQDGETRKISLFFRYIFFQ